MIHKSKFIEAIVDRFPKLFDSIEQQIDTQIEKHGALSDTHEVRVLLNEPCTDVPIIVRECIKYKYCKIGTWNECRIYEEHFIRTTKEQSQLHVVLS